MIEQKSIRLRGVQGNASAREDNGPPRTVTNVEKVEQYAVRFFDEAGAPRTNIAIVVAGRAYFAPNGIEWAQSLRPVSEWVLKQIQAKLPLQPEKTEAADIPSDSVDVLGGE